MAIAKDHELHRRRLGRNVGVALVLVGFIAVVFALSVVKITTGEATERFDHVVRPQLIIEAERLEAPAPLVEDGALVVPTGPDAPLGSTGSAAGTD